MATKKSSQHKKAPKKKTPKSPKKLKRAARQAAPKLLRLDFGAGSNPAEGFEGVDILDFGQKWKVDLRAKWPWADESVEAAHASHFLEHLTGAERVHFVNELYRVLAPDGKCSIVVPHWASNRAYGDITHQWPPVSEMWLYYLNRIWRVGDKEKGIPANAPHSDVSMNSAGYACNFSATWGYGLHPELLNRNEEYQQHASKFWKEAAQDMIVHLVKLPLDTQA